MSDRNGNHIHQLNRFLANVIGSDMLIELMESLPGPSSSNYPPCNVKRFMKHDVPHWEVELALAGIPKENLSVVTEEGRLTIKHTPKSEDDSLEEGVEFLGYAVRNISNRAFERTFQLADHVEVKSVKMKDGILTIELFKNIPEPERKRVIEIED